MQVIKKNTNTKYISSTHRKNRDNKGDTKPLPQPPRGTQEHSKGSKRGAIRRRRDTGLGKMGVAVDTRNSTHSNGFSDSNANSRNSEMKLLMRLTSVSIITLMCIFFYWSFWPFEPIRMQTPIQVLTPQVKAGESVTLNMNFNKRSDCTPEIKWYLVDGFILKLSDSGVRRPKGEQNYVREILIPESAPIEKMVHLRIEYSCRVNPLRVINYSWDTEQFEIIK